MHSHQSNKVVALLELEEIIEGFPGLSDVIPNDLKGPCYVAMLTLCIVLVAGTLMNSHPR